MSHRPLAWHETTHFTASRVKVLTISSEFGPRGQQETKGTLLVALSRTVFFKGCTKGCHGLGVLGRIKFPPSMAPKSTAVLS